MIAALDFALVGALKGGADGDDPAWARHLQLEVGVVGEGHELGVAWSAQDGMDYDVVGQGYSSRKSDAEILAIGNSIARGARVLTSKVLATTVHLQFQASNV